MIRVIYEPRIPSTYIKDEVWYPEINRDANEYYNYLFHEAGRTNGLTVITYSPIILDCLEVISLERNIEIQVEMEGKCYTCTDGEKFRDVYKIHAQVMQDVEVKRWNIKNPNEKL